MPPPWSRLSWRPWPLEFRCAAVPLQEQARAGVLAARLCTAAAHHRTAVTALEASMHPAGTCCTQEAPALASARLACLQPGSRTCRCLTLLCVCRTQHEERQGLARQWDDATALMRRLAPMSQGLCFRAQESRMSSPPPLPYCLRLIVLGRAHIVASC